MRLWKQRLYRAPINILVTSDPLNAMAHGIRSIPTSTRLRPMLWYKMLLWLLLLLLVLKSYFNATSFHLCPPAWSVLGVWRCVFKRQEATNALSSRVILFTRSSQQRDAFMLCSCQGYQSRNIERPMRGHRAPVTREVERTVSREVARFPRSS